MIITLITSAICMWCMNRSINNYTVQQDFGKAHRAFFYVVHTTEFQIHASNAFFYVPLFQLNSIADYDQAELILYFLAHRFEKVLHQFFACSLALFHNSHIPIFGHYDMQHKRRRNVRLLD